MDVRVDLALAEGQPTLSVMEVADGLRVVADYRLSEAQVDKACAHLGAAGPAICDAWRARVGLSARQPAR